MKGPPPIPATYFDRPGRSSDSQLAAQKAQVESAGIVTDLLAGLPGPICLLNDDRQIVVVNQAASELLQSIGREADPIGLRVGEAIDCVFAEDGPDGCGTSPACRHCGLGRANRVFGIKPGRYTREVRIRSGEGAVEKALTLSVHLSPLNINGTPLRLCALTDLTAIKRREALENIFFHDVLNTAQAVQGAAELIPVVDDDQEQDALARVVSENARGLVGEIEAQRDLLAAEDGTLNAPLLPVSVSAIAERAAGLYRHSRFGGGRTIAVQAAPDDVVATSSTHLFRCVGNLLKNALEASVVGEVVRISVTVAGDELTIDVHNDAVMPPAVQAQVFQRSFSTKAASGRGIGTYSVRLLVARYLHGTVSFVSAGGKGTTFTIRLPRRPANDQREGEV